MEYRIEKDTLGEVKVEKTKLWGPQTQRSIENFEIGEKSSMPIEIIKSFAYVKKAAAFIKISAFCSLRCLYNSGNLKS